MEPWEDKRQPSVLRDIIWQSNNGIGRDTMRLPNMVGDVTVEEVVGPHKDGMICEKHPEREWPHDDCAGPGIPLSERISALVGQRDNARRQLLFYQVALNGTAMIGDDWCLVCEKYFDSREGCPNCGKPPSQRYSPGAFGAMIKNDNGLYVRVDETAG